MEKQGMKVTVETSLLGAALSAAAVAVDNRISLPILGNVRIEAGNSSLIISTTNLDLYVTQTVPAQIRTQGAVCVPFSLLQRLVGRLRSTQTEIESLDKSVKIQSGEVTAIFETLPVDEFPPPPQQDRSTAIKCDAKAITIPFSKVAHAISVDSTQYHLMGVNLRAHEGGTAFAATNGRRLAVFTGKELTKENVIIPDVFVKAVLKINPSGEIQIVIADGLIALISEAVEIICKLVESKYPNWEQVIPVNGSNIFGCDRKELTEALRTCAIFSDKETRALEITGKGKEIEISKDDNIKARILGNELTGQPKLTMRFNVDYMLDALSVLDAQNVTVRCSDPSAGMMIAEGAFKAVIMPMQTK